VIIHREVHGGIAQSVGQTLTERIWRAIREAQAGRKADALT